MHTSRSTVKAKISSSGLEQMMSKLVSRTMLVLLAMAGSGSAALAQVPGGAEEVLCQVVVDGFVVVSEDGGTFPLGPASCEVRPSSRASIGVQPFSNLSASADPSGVGEGAAAVALASMQYDFAVTGGHVGDLVPVLVLSSLQAEVSGSPDPNQATSAAANIVVRTLSPVSGARNEDSAGACDVSPGECGQPDAVEADLAITVASGAAGRVFMQVLVAASGISEGPAFARIDPFIFVDPSFANAADYTITVEGGVGNALPAVPEPGVWALLLPGLAGLGAAGRRRRPWAVS